MKLINARQTNTYEIRTSTGERESAKLVGILEENGLRVTHYTASKTDDQLTYVFKAYGTQDRHQAAMDAFFDNPEFSEFRVL